MPNGFINEIRLDARGLQETRSRVPALKAIALVLLTISCRSTPALGQQPPGVHVPQAVRTLKSLGRLDANKFLDLGLGMAFRSGTNIDETLRGLYDPADPSFRHFLSPQQFDLRFAPTQDSINRVEAFARSNGLQVLSTPGNMVVHVRGTATNIEKAFRLELNLYQHPTENRTFYSPASEPFIPSDVPISHITGLDNFVLPRPPGCYAVQGSDRADATAGVGVFWQVFPKSLCAGRSRYRDRGGYWDPCIEWVLRERHRSLRGRGRDGAGSS